MERALAYRFVEALEANPFVPELSHPDKFVDILVAREMPFSSRFYEKLPHTSDVCHEGSDRYHETSMRRVLRNRQAGKHALTWEKRLAEAVLSALGVYSSSVATRDLRSDRDIINLLLHTPEEFSLVAKVNTFESRVDEDGKDTLFKVTRPLLIVLDAERYPAILEWQARNTTYKADTGLFGRFKRIHPNTYLHC